MSTIETTCCVVGGGPAGMVLGFLLARAGVDVVVLEKHGDFLRDFRGDTIHPSTLQVIHELGLLDELLSRPYQQAPVLKGVIGGVEVTVADFAHLPTARKFIALMPQWDFLDFLSGHARRYPGFHLHMQARVDDLIEESGRVVGVRASTPDGPIEVRANLTIGADGRHSTVRDRAGLHVEDLGAPIDVLWMRVSRLPTDPDAPMGRFDAGSVFVMIYRGDYWQCGFVIPKGGIDEVHKKGLPAFHRSIREAAPFLGDRAEEIRSWDDVKLLTITVDHLLTWHRPGLLCIGDSAHAMSPIGGVGINLAIQDAVATANLLAPRLRRDGQAGEADLAAVQARREWPTRMTQRLQVLVQDNVIGRVIGGSAGKLTPPWPVKLLRRFPVLRRIPARIIGMGFRPEHVRTPEVAGVAVS